jgi:hypothetical protein
MDVILEDVVAYFLLVVVLAMTLPAHDVPITIVTQTRYNEGKCKGPMVTKGYQEGSTRRNGRHAGERGFESKVSLE